MSALTDRLAALAKNPKARAALDKAREQAAKPENRPGSRSCVSGCPGAAPAPRADVAIATTPVHHL